MLRTLDVGAVDTLLRHAGPGAGAQYLVELRHLGGATASLAAILNATTPLFALLLGAVRLREPLTSRRLARVVLGVAGVAVLVGLGPLQLDRGLLLATIASLAAALLYALGGIYAKTRFPTAAPTTLATGQQLGAAALLLVPTLALPPAQPPSVGVGAAVVALALASTALGFALFYRLVARLGPTGALSVTFLVPVFGLAWGALFLGEPLTLATAAGLVIILGSVALVTDARTPRRRNRSVAPPAAHG